MRLVEAGILNHVTPPHLPRDSHISVSRTAFERRTAGNVPQM